MSGLTLDWIIKRLGVSGQGTKQEVLNALKNASPEELKELAASCIFKVAIEPCLGKITETVEMMRGDTNGKANKI